MSQASCLAETWWMAVAGNIRQSATMMQTLTYMSTITTITSIFYFTFYILWLILQTIEGKCLNGCSLFSFDLYVILDKKTMSNDFMFFISTVDTLTISRISFPYKYK